MTECWVWPNGQTTGGYGVIWDRDRGVSKLAHRVAYEMFIGPIPEGLCVCHTCDNPLCVNPDHLWLGTRLDNNADRGRKGRTVSGEHFRHNPTRGSANVGAKLTEDQVRDIRRRIRGGESNPDIAKIYGVARNTVSQIRTGASWSHIE